MCFPVYELTKLNNKKKSLRFNDDSDEEEERNEMSVLSASNQSIEMISSSESPPLEIKSSGQSMQSMGNSETEFRNRLE